MNGTQPGEVLHRTLEAMVSTAREQLAGGLIRGDGDEVAFRERIGIFRNMVRSAGFYQNLAKKTLDQWRDSLTSGEQEYCPDTEQALKASFEAWLSLARFLLETVEADYRKGFLSIKRHQHRNLNNRVEEVRMILKNWSSQVGELFRREEEIALPPGLRITSLTREEARVIKEIANDPSRPAHEGREMPTVDASFLLNGSR